MTTDDQQTLDELLAHEEAHFGQAVKAVISADVERLARQLDLHPDLVHARSSADHRSTLLHYVAANGIEDGLQLSSESVYQFMRHCSEGDHADARQRVLKVTQLLLDAGAEVDATCDTYGGNSLQTPMNLLVSSGHPAEAGVQADLVELLVRGGAKVDGLEDDSSPIVTALAFGFPAAVKVLTRCGARSDNLVLAAAANNLEHLRDCFRGGEILTGDLSRCSNSWFQMPQEARVAAELALVFASMCSHSKVVRFLLEAGVDIDAIPPGSHMTGSALHTACLLRQTEVVETLINAGADPTRVEPRYEGTPLDWAYHGGSQEIVRMLKRYVPEYRRMHEGGTPEIKALTDAVFSGDAERVADVIDRYKLTPSQLDGPWFYFDAPAVVQSKSNLPLIDVLINAGADINKKSDWWAGGFGVLDDTQPGLAEELIKRGADVDVWAAASLAKLDRLRELIQADPGLVRARGGDGKTPLHYAQDVRVAEYLLGQGAEIDARDIDHESTPAQYHVASRPKLTRYLVQQGCETDIMLAAALGDTGLIERILSDDPNVIRTTIDRHWFPTSAADSIYCWTLGWYYTAHQVAQKFRHERALQMLMRRSPPDVRLVNACLLGRRSEIARCLAEHPDVMASMGQGEQRHIAHAARNNQQQAVHWMLEAGFSVNAVGQHEATPLHWAAFHGNAEMVREILAHDPPLESRDADFKATPLEWARHGCQHGWYRDQGDYPGTVEALISAGCAILPDWPATGHDGVDRLF